MSWYEYPCQLMLETMKTYSLSHICPTTPSAETVVGVATEWFNVDWHLPTSNDCEKGIFFFWHNVKTITLLLSRLKLKIKGEDTNIKAVFITVIHSFHDSPNEIHWKKADQDISTLCLLLLYSCGYFSKVSAGRFCSHNPKMRIGSDVNSTLYSVRNIVSYIGWKRKERKKGSW